MHELERTSLRIVKWTCEELLMKGVRRERYTGSMETTPTMMMRHTGCMTMMIMMMNRFMQCEPDSASKASKHLDVLLDNLQLDPNARNPLFTEKCCQQGAPWRFTQCVSVSRTGTGPAGARLLLLLLVFQSPSGGRNPLSRAGQGTQGDGRSKRRLKSTTSVQGSGA